MPNPIDVVTGSTLIPVEAMIETELAGSPFSAGGTILTGAPIGLPVLGIAWLAQTIPVGYGRTFGAEDIYYDRLCQFVAVATPVAGHPWPIQIENVHTPSGVMLFSPPLPQSIILSLGPGVEMHVYALSL
jgi:hypothetical protein